MTATLTYYLFNPPSFCEKLRPAFDIQDDFERFATLSTEAIERFLKRPHIQELAMQNGRWEIEALVELRERALHSQPEYDPFLAILLYDCLIGEATERGGHPEPTSTTRRNLQAAGFAQVELMALIYGQPIEQLCMLAGALQPALNAFRMPCTHGSVGYIGDLYAAQNYERITELVELGRLPHDEDIDYIWEAYETAEKQTAGLCMIVCSE